MEEDLPAAKPANGSKPAPFTFGKPTSKPSSSPFLPPSKTYAPPKVNGTSSGPYTIDDVEDDDDIMEIQEVSPPKASSSGKSKSNGFAKRPSPPPIVVSEITEDEDEDMSSPTHAKASKPSLVIEAGEPYHRLGRSPSLGPHNVYSPTVPSPLRLVSMPEEDELAEDSSFHGTPAAEPVVVEVVENGDAMEEDDAATPEEKAKRVAVSSLPVYKFDLTVVAAPDNASAAEALKVLRVDLPKYDVTTLPLIPMGYFPAPYGSPAPPMFAWADIGFKPKPASGWTCSLCGLQNPLSATEKCTVCDAPAPKAKKDEATKAPPPPSAPVVPFNFAAAGFTMKAPDAGSWTCSVCMVPNKADATTCISCTSRR